MRANAQLRLVALFGLVAMLAATIAPPGATTTSPAPPTSAAARQLAQSGASSAVVLVTDHGHASIATAGKKRPAPTQRFRIGSVTKTFTAAIVMQLVEEKKLSLEDSLDRYLPGVVPDGRKITIRDLLDHQSGLANYTDYAAWLDKAEHSKTERPIDTLRFAASKPSLFTPGTEWSYSNTNSIALGLIIEKVTGRTYGQELRARLFGPLKLRRTELPTTVKLPDIRDPGENPNVSWADGGIVANAQDLARFFTSLLSGRVVSKASLKAMEQTVPVPGSPLFLADGLGLFRADLQCGHFWGNSGYIVDAHTLVEASPDGRRAAVLFSRGGSPRPPDMLSLLCY